MRKEAGGRATPHGASAPSIVLAPTPNENPYAAVTSRTTEGLYGQAAVMRVLLAAALSGATLALVACGGSTSVKLTGQVVTAAQRKAVFEDWYDGHLSDHHSCGAVVVASSHLPVDGPIYSTIAADLARYADKVCTHHPDLDAVEIGMSDVDVAAVAGAPQMPATGPCWDYWSKSRGNTGLAVCFRNGRVASKNQVHRL